MTSASIAQIAQIADVGLNGSKDRYGDLCVHAILDLRRSFSRAEVERAVQATISSFPVFGCVYEPRFFRDRWVPSRAPISEAMYVGIIKDLESDTERWTDWSLDPTRMRPFRVVVLPTPAGCRLIVSLSHLAVDGAGMAAVGHLLAASLYNAAPALPVETRRDVARALDGLSLRHLPILGRDMVDNLLQPLRVLGAGPRNKPYPADKSAKACSRQIVFEGSTIDALRARSGNRTSINDLLLAALALAAANRSSFGNVSVLYTMDLRRYSRSAHLSATNASSIMTTVVPRSAMTSLANAVKAVQTATARHRQSLAGPAFLLLPTLLAGPTPHGILRKLLPAVYPLMIDLPISRGLIFTNVGKLDQGLGPLLDDIIELRAVGPNIKGIPAPAVIAYGLRGRIHLELFAPPGLGEPALDELEHELREALSLTP